MERGRWGLEDSAKSAKGFRRRAQPASNKHAIGRKESLVIKLICELTPFLPLVSLWKIEVETASFSSK